MVVWFSICPVTGGASSNNAVESPAYSPNGSGPPPSGLVFSEPPDWWPRVDDADGIIPHNTRRWRSLRHSFLSRSGVEPPTGTIHPRQISSRNSKSGKTSSAMNLLIDSFFLSVVPPSPCVGGAFRSGVEPPTGIGSTPDRHRTELVCVQRGDFVVVFRVVADFFQPGAFARAGFFRVAALQ